MQQRGVLVLIVALGLTVCALGATVFFVLGDRSGLLGRVSSLEHDDRQSQQHIGALKKQIRGLGATPVPAPEAHARRGPSIQRQSAANGGGGSFVQPVPRRTPSRAPRPQRTSSPSPSRSPSHSASPSPSPSQVCVLKQVCVPKILPSPIVKPSSQMIKAGRGVPVLKLGQAALILLISGSWLTVRHRK